MRDLPDVERGYSAEVDTIDKQSWHALLPQFADATFYQTWSYGQRLWGEGNLSHVVLRCEGRVASVAQVRLAALPGFRSGVAYMNWGPLWRPWEGGANPRHLRNMLRALVAEFVGRRGCVLRVVPKVLSTEQNGYMNALFAEEGLHFSPDPLRTFVVDLQPSLADIQHNLHKSWRRSLGFARKQDLVVVEAADSGQVESLDDVYLQMKKRKRYIGSDQRVLMEVNRDLPPELKLRMLLCYHQKEIVAALGWSNIGAIAIPIVGFTGDHALQFKASFLLWWAMIEYCKKRGFECCDIAGVNAKRNPGGYFFKKGIAGQDAREMTYVGQFDAYRDSRLYFAFTLGLRCRGTVKRWRVRLSRLAFRNQTP